MDFPARLVRDRGSRDSCSMESSHHLSSSSFMAIPMSNQPGRSIINVPPPLPPPRHPLDSTNAPRHLPSSSTHSFGSRYASGGSGYGSLADGLPSPTFDACDFRRREIRPVLDEGYSSMSPSSRHGDPAPLQPSLLFNSFSLRSYDDSLKDKLSTSRSLDPKPARPHLSVSLTTIDHSQPLQRSQQGACSHPSLPARSPGILDDYDRFTQTPISAVASQGTFSPFSGERRSYNAVAASASDTEHFSYRHHRAQSSSIPDDNTESTQTSVEDNEPEGVGRLCIEDSRSEPSMAGQKRRASSPVARGALPGFFGPQGDGQYRRSEAHVRGSPTPRLGGTQGSFSSVSSSAGRSNSYVSTYSFGGAPGSAISTSFDRRSPGPFSPGGALSPLVTEPSRATSQFGMQMPLEMSPRGVSVARIPSSQQRSVADSRLLPSPRKLTGGSRPVAGVVGLQDFYMCECCPKKSKRFDTLEELSAHEAEKQYECTFCGNRFKNKNEAERHQNSLHVRPHSWSCSALTSYERAYHENSARPGQADICGYCGDDFERRGDFTSVGSRSLMQIDWDERVRHLQEVHKFRECNSSKKFYRADHFRQHLKHSHAGTSGKWTNMLENACMIDEDLPPSTVL